VAATERLLDPEASAIVYAENPTLVGVVDAPHLNATTAEDLALVEAWLAG